MKEKSVFSKIILLVILSIICVILTIGIALFAGSYSVTLFDFQNLNYANVIPVLVLGGFISFIAIGITILFISRSIALQVKKHLTDNDGGNKQ